MKTLQTEIITRFMTPEEFETFMELYKKNRIPLHYETEFEPEPHLVECVRGFVNGEYGVSVFEQKAQIASGAGYSRIARTVRWAKKNNVTL